MALPKKGSRSITIDGTRYRWLARYESVHWTHSDCCPTSLTVVRADGPGQRLQVYFQCYAQPVVIPQEQAVTPGIVRAIILAALERGWQPAAAGPPFEMQGQAFFPPSPRTTRLTPAQIAVRSICGSGLHPAEGDSLQERIREGHDFLVEITGKDFGYDLQAWHDHLKESRDGGYTYGRDVVLPRIMQAARLSPKWQEAVRSLAGAVPGRGGR